VWTTRDIIDKKDNVVLYGYDIYLVTRQDDKVIIIVGDIFRYDIFDKDGELNIMHYLTDKDFI